MKDDKSNPSSPNNVLSERRTGWDRAIKEAGEIELTKRSNETFDFKVGFDEAVSHLKHAIRSLRCPFPPGEGDGGGIGGGEKDLGTITAPLTEPQNG